MDQIYKGTEEDRMEPYYYSKMNTGEDGVVKSIVSLVGACLFIIGASIVFPAFFGYRI